jgi:hypothetical protein
MNDGGLDGIHAELRGYVQTLPRMRFHPSGVGLWEFGVRLTDSWSAVTTETVLVRVPDEHYNTLQRWVLPGKHLMVRGMLHLVRWTGKGDGKDRARLIVEPTREVMPLDERIQGSEPAALDYADPRRYRQLPLPPEKTVSVTVPPADRAAQVRALLEDEPAPQDAATRKRKRNARKYDEIFGNDAT